MKLTEAELGEIWQATEPSLARKACPPAESLAQAAAGELSTAARERLADHLIVCADCAGELRVLQELHQAVPHWIESAPAPSPIASGQLTAKVSQSWIDRLRAFFNVPVLAYAGFAALLLLSLALGWWALDLQRENQRLAARGDNQQGLQQDLATVTRELEQARKQSADSARQYETQIAGLRQQQDRAIDLSQPQLNVPIISLDPPDANRGAARQPATVIKAPAGSGLFTLVLNVAGQPSFSDYALEILNARGQTVWQGAGLRKSAENTFTLALPQRLLPAGRYRLRLDGLRQGRQTRLEEYPIQIVYQ